MNRPAAALISTVREDKRTPSGFLERRHLGNGIPFVAEESFQFFPRFYLGREKEQRTGIWQPWAGMVWFC